MMARSGCAADAAATSGVVSITGTGDPTAAPGLLTWQVVIGSGASLDRVAAGHAVAWTARRWCARYPDGEPRRAHRPRPGGWPTGAAAPRC